MVFSKFFGADKTPVAGVDISQDYIVFSQVKKAENALRLEHLIRVPTPAGAVSGGTIVQHEVIGEALREIIDMNDVEDVKINVSIPSNVPFMRTVTLPDLPFEELRIIAQDEASSHLPYQTADANLDYALLENTRRIDETTSRRVVDVLIVAVQKATAQKYVDMADAAKIKLNSIDVSTFSMIKSLAHSNQIEDDDSLAVSVLVGYENCDISIISKGMPLFTHMANTGKKNIIETISTGLGLTPGETEEFLPRVAILVPGLPTPNDPQIVKAATLVRMTYNNICTEISKAIHFYKTQRPKSPDISKIVLGGSGMCVKNSDKFIANRLKIDAELANPLKNISTDDQLDDYYLPTLVTSVGLALKGM